MNRTLRKVCIGIAAVAYVTLCSLGAGSCNAGPNANNTCLQCHNGQLASDVSEFRDSPHDFMRCARCHGDGTAHVRNGGRGGLFIQNPDDLPFAQEFQVCADCHEGESEQYTESGHFEAAAASCYDCHDIHQTDALVLPAVDNSLCMRCHAAFGFASDEAISAHTQHSVDPAGSGASRCTACHMPPLEQGGDSETDHTLDTVQPIVSALAAEAQQTVPPNSCAGTDGCHDGSSAGEPVFDVNDPQHMRILQTIYETWFPGAVDEQAE
ncbi:MAG: cytochrome c3 family protein [FCB group bacterium]|jgi:predicted CXXCH cytochrome family protein|nr:cytochrome c3 family protein [FCB group bacterium]